MKPQGVKYIVIWPQADCLIPFETVGTLYVVNGKTGNAFWFDNLNQEWHKSIFATRHFVNGIHLAETEKEVESFDNGFINTNDLWDIRCQNSILRRYPNEFDVELFPEINNPKADEVENE